LGGDREAVWCSLFFVTVVGKKKEIGSSTKRNDFKTQLVQDQDFSHGGFRQGLLEAVLGD